MIFVQAGWLALLRLNGQDSSTSCQVFIKINYNQTPSVSSKGEKKAASHKSRPGHSEAEGYYEALCDISSL